jgi:hypothetical protein
MEILLTLIGGLICFGVPISLIVLWNRMASVEASLKRLIALSEANEAKGLATRPANPPPVAAPTSYAAPTASSQPLVAAVAIPVVVAPAPPLVVATPPPLPTPPAPTTPSPTAATAPQPTPVTPVVPSTPPPIASRPVATTPPEDPWANLRKLGLLPPVDLKGEFALGSWWAVRIAGLLAVASVVFLAIWLNLRSTLPPWLRLAEILSLGGIAGWLGRRLEPTRRDLGRVLFTVGLTIFQFAAWAAYGLERMRVLDTPVQAATLQFVVALVVGAVALNRRDQLIGQLAIVFATVATGFALRAGAAPLSVGLEAGSIALLGGMLLARAGWTSSAALSLLASLAMLLWLRPAGPDVAGVSLAVQVGAGLTFLSLWLADRFGRVAEASAEAARNSLLGAAFLAPATLAISIAPGADGKAVAAGLVALAAFAVGCFELGRRRVAAEVLLAAGLFFAAAAAAWKIEPTLTWLAWMIAAGLAQLLFTRTHISLLRWGSKLLTIVGTVAYVTEAPTTLWICLLAPAIVGSLTAWRLRPAPADAAATAVELGRLDKILDLAGLGVLTCFVQGHLPAAVQPCAWLVVVPAILLFRRPAVLWALVPAILWTLVTILQSKAIGPLAGDRAGMLGWALLLAAGSTLIIRRSETWPTLASAPLRPWLAFAGAALLGKALDLGLVLPPAGADWRWPLLWCLGAGLTFGLAEVLRRLSSCERSPFAAMLAFWPAFVLAIAQSADFQAAPATLPLWLIGQTIALVGFVRFRRAEPGTSDSWAALFAVVIAGTVFFAFPVRDSDLLVLHALALSATTFGLGWLLKSRSVGWVGVVGLLFTTFGALTLGAEVLESYLLLTLLLVDASMVWMLKEWDHPVARFAQHTFAFTSACFGLALVAKLLAPHLPPAFLQASCWLAAAALTTVASEAFFRATGRRSLGLVATLAFFPAYLMVAGSKTVATTLGATPLWLTGLGLALFSLARQSRDDAKAGSLWRGAVCAACTLLLVNVFGELAGAQVSLFWALAAALTFALGLVLDTKIYRMVGLVGLIFATGHVILYDVQDLVGRIVACAAIAAAFFGVAWLYGRFVKKEADDPKDA